MNRLVGHIPCKLTTKGRQILAVFLLCTLCLPSSCALKQGIIFFFSAQTIEQSARVGTVKTVTRIKADFKSGISSCKMQTALKESVQLTFRNLSKTQASMPFVFFILPGFLASLLIADKRHHQLPIPYSWFRRTRTSIFLWNRLLLI